VNGELQKIKQKIIFYLFYLYILLFVIYRSQFTVYSSPFTVYSLQN